MHNDTSQVAKKFLKMEYLTKAAVGQYISSRREAQGTPGFTLNTTAAAPPVDNSRPIPPLTVAPTVPGTLQECLHNSTIQVLYSVYYTYICP